MEVLGWNFEKSKVALDYVRAHDGGTFTPSGEVVELNRGYMVSIAGHEKHNPTMADVKAHFKIARRKGAFVGFWIENGIVCLDISVFIEEKEEAINKGLLWRQKAIYDNKNKVSIYIGGK